MGERIRCHKIKKIPVPINANFGPKTGVKLNILGNITIKIIQQCKKVTYTSLYQGYTYGGTYSLSQY